MPPKGRVLFPRSRLKKLGHGEIANLPMTSVPLQLWLSERLKSLRPDLARRAKAAKSSYRLDELVHFALDLASLSSPDRDETKSLFPPQAR